MAKLNLLLSAGTALIPLILGFVWYHPKVLGSAWQKASGVTDEQIKGSNMPVILFTTFVMGFFLSVALHSMVIHQFGLQALLIPEKDHALSDGTLALAKDVAEQLTGSFRTFRHGVIHGVITGLFFVFPLITINALFERKSWKYILIHGGYWTLSLALMGGVICQFA